MINARCEVNIFVCALSFIFTRFAQMMKFSDWQQSSEIGANLQNCQDCQSKERESKYTASTLVSSGSLCSLSLIASLLFISVTHVR